MHGFAFSFMAVSSLFQVLVALSGRGDPSVDPFPVYQDYSYVVHVTIIPANYPTISTGTPHIA